MLFIKLDTVETATSLTKLCEKYKNEYDIETDIVHGRYVTDGCSLLCVVSMIGKIIKVSPDTKDGLILNCFKEDLKNLGGFDSEEDVCGL